VSDIGTIIQTTALMWLVRTTTNSNIWIGVITLVHTLPVLLHAELAGYLADKQCDRGPCTLAAGGTAARRDRSAAPVDCSNCSAFSPGGGRDETAD